MGDGSTTHHAADSDGRSGFREPRNRPLDFVLRADFCGGPVWLTGMRRGQDRSAYEIPFVSPAGGSPMGKLLKGAADTDPGVITHGNR